jgi:ribosomal protein S18 acetylase RimI-like enzyme
VAGLAPPVSLSADRRAGGVVRDNVPVNQAEIEILSDWDEYRGAAELAALTSLLTQVSSTAPPLTPERLGTVLRTPATTVLVARLDGQIVGMALLLTLTTFGGDFGYVEEVVVDSEFRGPGISAALMRELLRAAARKGLRHVDLTSRPAREAANNLYRSTGFTVRETNCYRHDLRDLSENSPDRDNA